MSKILLFFLFLSLIFNTMPIQTWSGLQKSSTDDETIEQAIARLIDDHNSDPTAHTASGESLDLHKNADIIDHPAGSIVADKFSNGDLVVDTHFSNLDGWTVVGTAIAFAHSGLDLGVDTSGPHTSSLISQMGYVAPFFDSSTDIYFDTYLYYDFATLVDKSYFGLLYSELSTSDGFGFQVRSGDLYAHARTGTTTQELLLSSININDPHFYSAVYSNADKTVEFYVDKVLVYTAIFSTTPSWHDTLIPSYYLANPTSGSADLFVNYLYATRKILTP